MASLIPKAGRLKSETAVIFIKKAENFNFFFF